MLDPRPFPPVSNPAMMRVWIVEEEEEMLAQVQIKSNVGWQGTFELETPDERLIAAVAAGDGWALSKLYERDRRLVLWTAYKTMHDSASAEEIAQEVFYKLWRCAREYQPERGRFSTWLISITRNACIDELRHRRARPVLEPVDDETKLDAASEANGEDNLDHILERTRVANALAHIPAEQRHVIELAFFEGLSHPEIASRCGDPLGTVKTRLRLGMEKLKGLLEE